MRAHTHDFFKNEKHTHTDEIHGVEAHKVHPGGRDVTQSLARSDGNLTDTCRPDGLMQNRFFSADVTREPNLDALFLIPKPAVLKA